MLTGELAALTAAAFWALSTVLFGQLGKTVRPLLLNWVKGAIAIALILLTLALRSGTPWPMTSTEYGALGISGAIGIGLGDTAYFKAINTLGARQALLMESLAPPLTALIAVVFLRETLSWVAWGGILLTVLGVGAVISERVPATHTPTTSRWQGIGFGLVAVLSQAVGAVLSRAVLAGATVDPLASSLLRLLAGLAIITLFLGSQGNFRQQVAPLKALSVWRMIGLAAFLGTYLGIWLQQVAFQYSPAGIAQALLATSPLFVLPIAALMGDRLTLRSCLGVVIAIGGVWLLVSQGNS